MSNQICRQWKKQRGNYRLIVIATKKSGRMWDGPNGEGLSRSHIMQAVEDSLRRLDTDYIDLYQIHWDDLETPMDETLRALDDLVSQGKVRYLGCSNISAWRLMKSLCISDQLGLARYNSLQPHYNLVHREEFEAELKPLCESEQIGVIPYSPLAGGFLTGKYQSDAPQPDSARAGGVKHYFNDDGWRTLHAVENVAAERNAAPLQIALAWQLAQPVISSPIIGANSIEQLSESLAAVDIKLTEAEMTALDEASKA
jgi:aryl-alcohol dehydrogenase-like predicted oxidoreductase